MNEHTATYPRRGDDLFRKAFHAAPVALIITRLCDGVMLEVNDAYCRLVEADRSDLIGKSTLELNLWHDPADRSRLTDRLRQDGRVRDEVVPFRTLRGKECWLKASIEPLEIDGEDCILSSAVDITGQKEAEDRARESETMARAVLQIPEAVVFLIDREGTLLEANDVLTRRFGMSRHEMIGRSLWSLIPPDVAEKRREHLRRVLTAGELSRFEDEREGRWNESFVLPIRNERGEATKAVVLAFDITERKRMETDLRESETMVRTLLSMPFAVAFLIDNEGAILEANDAFAQRFGMTRAEIVGRNAFAIIPPDAAERRKAIHRQVLATKQMVHHEDGRQGMWNEFYALPVIDAAGNVAKTVVVGFDVTERKRMEQALRESEERYRRLFEVEPDAIFLVEVDSGRYLDANPAAVSLYGYSRDELLTMTVDDISAEPAETRRSLAARETSVSLRWHRKKDGTVFPVDLVANYMETQGRRVIVAAIRDRTDQLRVEEELRQYGRQLVEIKEQQRKALASELHDRIGPDLSALGMNISVISGSMPESIRRQLGDRIAGTQALLDGIAKSLRGIMAELRPPVLDDYGLPAALRWYADLLASQRGIMLDLRLDEAVPRLPVEKELALFRVVQEAVTNAAKHAAAKGVRISLERKAGLLLLAVSDEGPGFDPEETRPQPSGSGWGMTIMRERAASIGAALRIESRPLDGTTVSVEVEV